MTVGPTMTQALAGGSALRRARQWCIAHAWPLAVYVAMLGWGVASFALVRSDYLGFRLARFDLGNMVQAVWSTAEGRPLDVTTTSGEQMARLGGHVDPILLLLTPLWILVPSPLMLAAAQIAAVALGALPVFWLGRRHLGSEQAAGLLALAYLASPWLAWTAQDAIHPKTFAIPLFLFAVWFLDSHRLGAFAVCAVLAAACGELMGVSIAALGIWYALARGRRRAGLTIAALGLAWSFVALYVVVPSISGDSSVFYGLYENVGGSPWGVVETAFTDPLTIVSALTGKSEIFYVVLLSAPLAGAFLLAPGLAAVALPYLLANMLAGSTGPTDPRHHYIAGILPFLFAAAAIGLARLPAARRVHAAGLVLALSVAISLLLGPWPGPAGRTPMRYDVQAAPGHGDVLRRAVALVPDDAPLAATNKVGSRMSARRYFFSIPLLGNAEQGAEWVVLDTHDVWLKHGDFPFLVERPPAELDAFRARLERGLEWAKVFEEDGVHVFRKR